MEIQRFSSGSPWEDRVSYSRAIRAGSLIEVSGTVAVDEQGHTVGPGDPFAQTTYALGKIIRFIEQAGGRKEDIVRTRIYVVDISSWEAVGKAHAGVLGHIRPVTSMVQVAALISPEYLVEVEATAVVSTPE